MEKLNQDWLDQLGVTAATQKNLDLREQKKQAAILKLGAEREKQSGKLRDGSNLKMVKKGSKSEKMLDEEDRNQTAEHDLDDQFLGFRLDDTDDQQNFKKHLDNKLIVEQMVLEMEAMMSDELDEEGNPVPLFSKEDIMAEVYDPLVRRGLVPETMVPNEFSRTKEMLDASFEAYGERLKKDKLSTGKRLFKENFGLAKTLVTSTISIAGSSLQLQSAGQMTNDEMATSWKPDDNIKALKQGLGEIPRENGSMATTAMVDSARMAFAGQALAFVTDVAYEGVNDVKDALSNRAKVAPPLAQGLLNMASAELVSALSETGLAMEVGSIFGVKADRAGVVSALKQDKFDAGQAVGVAELLGKACAVALQAVAPVPPIPGVASALGKAAAALEKEIGGGGLDTAKVLKALEDEEFDQVTALYQRVVKAGCAKAVTQELIAVLKRPEVRDGVMLTASETMNEAFTANEAPEPPPEVKNNYKHNAKHDAKWDHGTGEWICTVCRENTDDPEVYAGILDAKIAQLQRDQAALKWGATLVGMGIDTAANFIAPLAIVGCALKMARNLYEAATRTRDLVAFVEDRQGMFNAASAYSAPVTQFIRNAGIQQAHYYANAGFEAAKMIGAIIQCSGAMAAPAGVVVSASAGIAQAAEAVLYEAAKRLALEVAWSDYKYALSRPENRKAGLIALKNNPTLAKYAVAWGAVVKKDPLVADFMDACGLDATTLKDPGAKVDKVVSYLEVRMPDDNVVTGRSVEGSSAVAWVPGTVELTAKCWINLKALAESHAKLAPQDTLQLEAALQRYEKLPAEWRTAAKDHKLTEEQQRDWLARVEAVDTLRGLISTKRLPDPGGLSQEVVDIKGTMLRLLDKDRQLAKAGLPKKVVEPEKT